MPPRFRLLKASLREILASPLWAQRIAELDAMPASALVNALLACLPQGGEMTRRAAVALGRAVPRLGAPASTLVSPPPFAETPDSAPYVKKDTSTPNLQSTPATPRVTEEARVFIRRLMWHMNEESGNIGWGIPEAFGEILANHPGLAQEFHRILFSYITDTGHDDNFCDHDALRRSCHLAVARLLQAQPDLAFAAKDALTRSLHDADPQCRAQAAQTLEELRTV